MNHFSKRQHLLIRQCSLITAFFTCGCVNPFNTRFPQVVHRPAEMERREAQVHDPYPDEQLGPETGFRPLGYVEQRSEPQRAKDKFFTAMLRTQNRPSLLPQSQNPRGMRPVVTNPGIHGLPHPQVVAAPAPNMQVSQPPAMMYGQPLQAQTQFPSGVATVPPPVYYPPTVR